MERKVNNAKPVSLRLGIANILRMSMILIGLVFVVVGLLLILTILGALYGLITVPVGLAIIAMNVPKENVVCDNCEHTNVVPVTSDIMYCEQCNTATPLNWTK